MKNNLKFIFLLGAAFYVSTVCDLHAQSRSVPPISAASRSSDDDKDDSGSRFESPAREAVYRAHLARIENQHKQHLQRATETVNLSLELRRAYKQQPVLTPEFAKKLARLEKLARRVRSYAGGSDDGEATISTPVNISESLDKISTLAQKLQDDVETTSRRIVSAKIINTSNELIALSQHIRLQLKR